MPISVEADALHTAAGMLPRAMAVKAMADCTVAGSVHRKSTPMYISGVTRGSSTGRSAQPSRGKSTKVAAKMVRCRRQWPMPAKMASRESLAPCRKNSRLTMSVVATSSHCDTAPEAGRKLASATVDSSISVKLSGAKRGRAMGKLSPTNYRFVQPGCKAPIGRHGH